MLLLGVLLLMATGAFTGLAIGENVSGGPDYTVTMLNNPIATMNTLAVFVAGIGLTLLFCLGLLLTFRGMARRRLRAGDRGTTPAIRKAETPAAGSEPEAEAEGATEESGNETEEHEAWVGRAEGPFGQLRHRFGP